MLSLKFILKTRGGHWKALKKKSDLIRLDFHFRQFAWVGFIFMIALLRIALYTIKFTL